MDQHQTGTYPVWLLKIEVMIDLIVHVTSLDFFTYPSELSFTKALLYEDHMYDLQTYGNHSRCCQSLRVIVVNLSQGHCYKIEMWYYTDL